ncbi:MAG: twin-arginine translocase TatA/TatE family subunit [Candidatus Kapabacteria bacterium]|nr:twin-arginine translocase TatA/TatE family subunit [Candidatus Kapabacteria bacterium]
MFDIGGGELILIVLAIIVLFGPKKIPEIAQMFGKGMQEFKRAQSQFTSQFNEIKSEINSSIDDKPKPPPAPPSRDQQILDDEIPVTEKSL